MRHTLFTMIVLMSSFAHAEKNNLNNVIAEASLSQKRLHRQLLRILQGGEVSIAETERPAEPEESTLATNSPDYKVRLVPVHN
jgi:hypothetical protein